MKLGFRSRTLPRVTIKVNDNIKDAVETYRKWQVLLSERGPLESLYSVRELHPQPLIRDTTRKKLFLIDRPMRYNMRIES